MTEGRWHGPATEAEIRAIESAVGVALPAEYRAFLAARGSGQVGGTEIYGVAKRADAVPSLLFLLGRLEKRGFARPHGLVPISDVGNGDYVAVLSAALGNLHAGVVVFWRPAKGSTGTVERAAESFGEWLAARAG